MKIIHVTTVHHRYDTRIFYRECTNLSRLSPVTLLVSDGLGNENCNGVYIKDLYSGVSRISRFKNIVSFILGMKNKRSTIIHLHDPELYLISFILKVIGFKVVLDIHEDYKKQILLKKYIPSLFLRKIISNSYFYFERLILKIVDFSVVPQPSFLNKTNSVLVGNFMTSNEVRELQETAVSNKKRCFIYAGGISEERGLNNMLDLAEKLKEHDIFLKLAGNFQNERLKSQAKQHSGWGNIEYLGYLDRKKLLFEQKECLAAVILFNNVGQYHLSYSVKLFEYAASQLPIIMPNFGEWLSVNSKYKLGVNVNVEKISSDDIQKVLVMSECKAFLGRTRKFLGDHLLDDNISLLYKRYLGLFNGNK